MSTALLPHTDLTPLIRMVSDSVTSPHSKRAYGRCLREFGVWYCATSREPFSRRVVQAYRTYMEQTGRSPSTISLALSAIRKLAAEAEAGGLLSEGVAGGIERLRGPKILGKRVGNWLTRDQAAALLSAPDRSTLKGKRDAVALGLLLGCGLRRDETVSVTVAHIQAREGRPCIVDLTGKGGRVRTVAVPTWLDDDIKTWLDAAHIQEGYILRSLGGLNGHGQDDHMGERLSAVAVWNIVKRYAAVIGKPELAPHDLRRTFARLARKGGATLEQIRDQLGHENTDTTDIYTGRGQDYSRAACDFLGI